MSESGKGAILIVDDTMANLRLLTNVLREHGYVVRGAPNGEIALNSTRFNPPDLILLDVNMPDMDGYTVCEQLKADEATREIPVIFLSALDDALDKVKAFEVGGVDYITKPFQFEEVLARIENHLERTRLQARLEKAMDAADAANRAKSQFLANMSHEIRTPMNAILGYAQILAGDEALNTKQRHAVHTIENSGAHLLDLINDVLDLSKIEAGREELHLVDFNLGQLVRNLAAMFEMRCRQKGLGWEVECDLTAGRVRGDEQKLRQVLINLLGNAVKFTREGRVSLKAQAGADGRYRFEIADTGPGIAPERQAVIFDPFQQDAEGIAQGGTGLGLAIARRHVHLMEGTLDLDSAEGEGARFAVEVSLQPAQGEEVEVQEQWTQVRRLAQGHEVRALVVDDVETNRDILIELLAKVGVSTREAEGGPQALEQIAAEQPDMVFMDIRMPGMDGPEVLQRLQQLYGAALPKVVAISASVLDHQRAEYLANGFDAFLAKPFIAAQLYACLAELLGVEYEYAEAAPAPAEEPAPFTGPIALPGDVLVELRETVRTHDMTELRKQIAALEEMGEEARGLAGHLSGLARRYDIKGIGAVLQEIEAA